VKPKTHSDRSYFPQPADELLYYANREIGALKTDRSSWKTAWLDQRDATGNVAYRQYDKEHPRAKYPPFEIRVNRAGMDEIIASCTSQMAFAAAMRLLKS
jgi:hypothetical protein